jgi:hypothetical protein
MFEILIPDFDMKRTLRQFKQQSNSTTRRELGLARQYVRHPNAITERLRHRYLWRGKIHRRHPRAGESHITNPC